MIFSFGLFFIGEDYVDISEMFLVPFVFTLEYECTMLQKDSVCEILGPCFLHLHINADSIRGFCADVKPKLWLDCREHEIDVGAFDGHGFNPVFLL